MSQEPEPLRGDRARTADIANLATAGRWDAVVDTSGHVPGMVTAAASALRPVADRYVYISTVNAYRGWPDEPLADDSPVYDIPADMTPAAGATAALLRPPNTGSSKQHVSKLPSSSSGTGGASSSGPAW